MQLLRCLHQVAIDDGSWSTSALLLPAADPIDKVRFGGSYSQLEVVAAYRGAVRKLEKLHDGQNKAGKGAGKNKKKKDEEGDGS